MVLYVWKIGINKGGIILEDKGLSLNNNVTSMRVYEEFLYQLNRWYRSGDDISEPIIDLSEVEWLDSAAIPNILSIGNIMRIFHKKPIKLLLPNNMNVLNYLSNSNFFLASSVKGIELFEYDSELIDRANFFVAKENRDKHKIQYYLPYIGYYDIEKEEKQLELRSEIYEEVRYAIVPNRYREVIMDKENLSDNEVDVLLDVISEVICNSMLYSKSISYATIQTNRFKSIFSISDTGIGFKKSLISKKNYKSSIGNSENTRTIKDKKEYYDFFAIMEMMEYSYLQDRRNLWSLKNIIVNKGGTLRIHNNSTQVIYSSNKCAGCHKHARECVDCFLKSYNEGRSNIRIFKASLRGVHIEVELKNVDRGNR